MSIVFLNNEYVDSSKEKLIAHYDSGFTTGIGVFDSMLIENKEPKNLEEHFERMMHDSKIVVGLTPYCSPENFRIICDELISRNYMKEKFIRVRTTVTGGNVKAPLMPAVMPNVLIEAKASANPVNVSIARCVVVKDFPRVAGCILENCKRIDYSRSYAARRQAEQRGGDEAILVNTEGNVACAATSNVFIEEKGQLVTPPLSDGVLAGVTRRKLIESEDVKEESISIERLGNSDKIFLTNSFVGMRNVVLLN